MVQKSNGTVKRIATGIIALGIVGVAPVIPDDMKWAVSYETIAFATADGDLGTRQYAVNPEGGWYVRKVAKNKGQFTITDKLADIKGKKEVSIKCEKCAYYNEFTYGSQRIRVAGKEVDYNKLREVINAPQPKRKTTKSILQATTARGAIAFDAASEDDENCVALASSLSWSHTTAGSNRVLAAGSGFADAILTDADITAATYNSLDLTSIRRDTVEAGGTDYASELWYIIAPTLDANTISLTFNGTNTVACGQAMSLTGVSQSSPIDASTGGSQLDGNSISNNITTVASNAIIVDLVAVDSFQTNMIPGGSQVSRVVSEGNVTLNGGMSTLAVVTPASTAISWSEDSIFTPDWVTTIVSFAPDVPVIASEPPTGTGTLQNGTMTLTSGTLLK